MSFIPQLLLQTPLTKQSLRDIKPPFEVPQNPLSYLLLGVIIIVVVVCVIWIYIRKRRQIEPIQTTEVAVTRPPHEIALEQLETLETSSYDMETYHTLISYVIREYIAARYGIPALELTTSSLLHQMTREEIDKSCLERIQDFLTNCDRVKFASYLPKSSEADARMKDARWLIEVTMSF